MSVTSSCPPTSTEVSRSPPAIRRIEAARLVMRRTSTAADEQPADEHQGHDADHVEGQEEDEAELDRRLRIGRRRRRPFAGGRDDPLRSGHELRLQAPVAREVLLLEADEPKLVLAQAKGAGAPRSEPDQVLEARLQIRVLDFRPCALKVPRDRIELLAKGAEEIRVGDLERLAEKTLREARLGAQREQAAIPRQLPVGRALVGWSGCVVEGPVSGREKEDLVVDHREQDVADRAALALDIGGHGLLGLNQLDPALHGSVDPVDVLDEARRDPVHLLEQVLPYLDPPHRVHDLPESAPVGREFCARGGKLLAGVGRDEAGCGRDEKGTPLREQEGGVEVGNASLGDPALGVAHVEEGVASDEARGQREREGPAKAEVELPGNAETAAPGAVSAPPLTSVAPCASASATGPEISDSTAGGSASGSISGGSGRGVSRRITRPVRTVVRWGDSGRPVRSR